MSASQRRKGKTGEREVVKLAREFGLDAVRTWETAQAGDQLARACDVLIAGRPWQVKRRRSLKGLQDAIRGVWGVLLRADGGEWLALVRASDLFPLISTKHDT